MVRISRFDPAVILDTREKLIDYMKGALDSDYPNMMNIAYNTALRALEMHGIKLDGDVKNTVTAGDGTEKKHE